MTSTIIIRILGGLCGALPALAGLMLVDLRVYGNVVGDVALALLLTGPLVQFYSQGFLRFLLSSSRDSERSGLTCVSVYVAACMVGLSISGATGVLSWTDVLVAMLLVPLAAVAKLLETLLVAAERQTQSVLTFYIALPALFSFGLLLANVSSQQKSFLAVAAAQILAYMVCIASASAAIPLDLRSRLTLNFPSRLSTWASDFAAIRVFFFNGALLGANEQVPILLFRGLGFADAIPSFELARKMGSVPSVLLHAVSIHLVPRLITTAAKGEWSAFKEAHRKQHLFVAVFGLLYVSAMIGSLMVLTPHIPLLQKVELGVAIPLLLGALVTALVAPLGAVLIALRGEVWWMVGGIASLLVQIGLSYFASRTLGAAGVAIGVLAQNIVLSAVVGISSLALWRHAVRPATSDKLPQDAVFFSTTTNQTR